MALREIVRGGFFLGIAVGAGAAVVGPALWRTARPYAKSAVRAGLEGYAAARVAAARVGEEVEDLVAEVMHEIGAEDAGAAAGASAGAATGAAAGASAGTEASAEGADGD
ncbi:DUF5132 domain-containing protein [Faunimonas sp. B44]|uniref:DUF5132 domain-containing protein n=1 Tax=Faunimonas sp. B44 TaxID=3461493 RepID=UPI0040449F24